MLIFGNMAADDGKKMTIVLECMDVDYPCSPKDYIASLMDRDPEELIRYLKQRKREQATPEPTHFKAHP
jgi:hypothetical protein